MENMQNILKNVTNMYVKKNPSVKNDSLPKECEKVMQFLNS